MIVAALCGCGSGSGSARGVAEDYVTAINKHDGDRICDLFVEKLQKKYRYRGHPCGRIVGGFIGYGEESDTPTFVRGRLRAVGRPFERRNYGRVYTGVPLSLTFRFDDPTEPPTPQVRFRDVLWLERVDGSWRIAKESLALYRAWAAYQIPEDVLAPPDPLAAQHAQQAAARERAQEQSEYRRSFVTRARRAVSCSANATAVDDPRADVMTYDVGSPPTRAAHQAAYRGFDVRHALVEANARRICARFEFAGRLKPPLLVRLSLGDTASLFECCSSLELRWLSTGEARFGSPVQAYAFDRRIRRLVPIDGAPRIFIGTRTVSLMVPLVAGLHYPADSAGWTAVAGNVGMPSFTDWVPGQRRHTELWVRLRDGRVMLRGR